MDNSIKNDEVIKLYGEFLINFESVCHLMRFGILHIIFPDHSDKQMRQNEILMESLTADQVRKKFIALLTDDFQSETEVYKLAKTVSDVYEKLIPIRNSFAHGTSYVGESTIIKEAMDGVLLLRHPKLKKDGLDLNYKKYEIDTLKLGVQLFERLKYAVAVISVTVLKKNGEKSISSDYDPTNHHISLSAELRQMYKKLSSYLEH